MLINLFQVPNALDPVPERPISARVTFSVIVTVSLIRVIAQHYFVSLSYMFLDKKTVLKIWLNLGLSLIIFRGTGPRGVCGKQPLFLCST